MGHLGRQGEGRRVKQAQQCRRPKRHVGIYRDPFMVLEDYAAGQGHQSREDYAARAAEARLGSARSYRKVGRAIPTDGGGKRRRIITRGVQDGGAETSAGGRH